jgi:hypothetical protein
MGPVLIVMFQAQQIAHIADAQGKVIEGDPVGVARHSSHSDRAACR